jgi:hypothetical protein
MLGLPLGDIQASARGTQAGRGGEAASGRGRKSSTKPSGSIVANAREVATVEALRAMPSAARRVMMDMVIAYGAAGSAASRKGRR